MENWDKRFVLREGAENALLIVADVFLAEVKRGKTNLMIVDSESTKWVYLQGYVSDQQNFTEM